MGEREYYFTVLLEPLAPTLLFTGIFLALACTVWVVGLLDYPEFQPIVTVQGGVISVRAAAGHIYLTARIKECCWYHGWAIDTALAPNANVLIFGQRAIVIRFPSQSRFTWRRRVAVGLTDEYHAIWEAFLKLAEVPHISNKSSEPTIAGDTGKA